MQRAQATSRSDSAEIYFRANLSDILSENDMNRNRVSIEAIDARTEDEIVTQSVNVPSPNAPNDDWPPSTRRNLKCEAQAISGFDAR